MVRDGWAFAFVKYSDRYAADQDAAEAAKAGLWAGSFVKPWEWRLGEAQAAQKTRDLRHQGEHQPRWRAHLSPTVPAVLSPDED